MTRNLYEVAISWDVEIGNLPVGSMNATKKVVAASFDAAVALAEAAVRADAERQLGEVKPYETLHDNLKPRVTNVRVSSVTFHDAVIEDEACGQGHR